MKKTAKEILTPEEQQRISDCVKEAEKSTSGEIVPMVVRSSYHYPFAGLLGALILSVLAALAVTAADSIRKAWGGLSLLDLWVFPGAFGVSFLLFHELIKDLPALKRLFITSAEIAEEVEEAALTSFYRKGLADTRDRTGVLIFVSMFERRAYVLADQGINEKVPQGTWQEIVDRIAQGFREGKSSDAICQAVTRCGELLRSHFPRKPDDRDELKNLIVES